MEEYGPTIVYFPGKRNVIADFLSRHPRDSPIKLSSDLANEIFSTDQDNIPFPLSFDVIATHQASDDTLQSLAHSNSSYQRVAFPPHLVIMKNNKIIVPQSLQKRLITWYHTSLAHPGIDRTAATIGQHFHWSTLSSDVAHFVQSCTTCQLYKGQRKKYGILPTINHPPTSPWQIIAVDIIGPWTVPQCTTTTAKTPFQLLALTIIDTTTHFIEIVALPNKESALVARALDRRWFCRYPRPLTCIHDAGTEFTGFEFQEMLESYGIRSSCITSHNPTANSILERTHQVIANQIRVQNALCCDYSSRLDDLQADLLDPIQWAMNSTVHTTLHATPGQLAFNRDMILPFSFLADWNAIRFRHQAQTDRDTFRENRSRIPHCYHQGDHVLLKEPTNFRGKLSKPTRGPFTIVDSSLASVNGTVVIARHNSHERVNIRRLLPFIPPGN